MSEHPYRGLPSDQFWSTGVAQDDILAPVRPPPFTIAKADRVAAAGSCFAQHIARHLRNSGFAFLQTEEPASPDEPIFSARFGNIYTPRQLRQLLLGAYGLHRLAEPAWAREDGRFIDPLRPQLFPEGFPDEAAVRTARRAHLLAVRDVFQDCAVFVFTLGLTECWLAADGTALPVPPGVLGVAGAGPAEFHNFTVAELRADLEAFIADLRVVNPGVRIILTVSPVPLVATYENRHVLVSNTYSKAALRVVAEEIAQAHQNTTYFPSYEIITAPQIRGAYFANDLRSVTEEGVAHVMRVFTANMLDEAAAPAAAAVAVPRETAITAEDRARYEALEQIICDEELLDAGGG